jgi:hypothetical protein
VKSGNHRNWREICADVLTAKDSERVDTLLEELLGALEERKRMRKDDFSESYKG